MKLPCLCPSCHGSNGDWGPDSMVLEMHLWGRKTECPRCKGKGFILVDSETGEELARL